MPRPANTYRAARRNEAKAKRRASRRALRNYFGYAHKIGQMMPSTLESWRFHR